MIHTDKNHKDHKNQCPIIYIHNPLQKGELKKTE